MKSPSNIESQTTKVGQVGWDKTKSGNLKKVLNQSVKINLNQVSGGMS